MEISTRCRNLRSPIRDIVAEAKKVEASGKKLYPFNIGDPNQFDFETPEPMRKALQKSMEERSGYYSHSEGEPQLLEAVASKENQKNSLDLSPEDMLITTGISEGLFFLLHTVIEPGRGDEILIPGPAYPVYQEVTKYASGRPVTYKLDEENNWQTDVDDLRNRVTDSTRLICVISPNNPTGSVLDKKTLKGIIDIAGEYDIPVCSDEIYDRLVFGDTQHHNLASLAKEVPVIGLNGFSKVYLAPGWRMGYAYLHDPEDKAGEILEGMKAVARQRLSATTPIMKACAHAFEDESHIPRLVKRLEERAQFAHKKLNSIQGIETVKPRGAFYIFPKVDLGDRWKNDEEFVLDVLRNTGLVLPYGSGFCPRFGKNHFRSVVLPPIETMDEAFSKLKQFMES